MKRVVVALLAVGFFPHAGGARAADDMVLVEGGPVKHPKSNYVGRAVLAFFIGKNEVTQKEWRDVMGNNPSRFSGDDRPVEMVSWYDCIEYCNRRSRNEGRTPYYRVTKSGDDKDEFIVTPKPEADGYRLPTELEWEYAASGGAKSRGFTYSGSHDIREVAWFWQNSGDEWLDGLWNWPAIEGNNGRTRPAGTKKPNELGLFDMSGNVREWCWDAFEPPEGPVVDPDGKPIPLRAWRGGGWLGGDFCAEVAYRGGFEPHGVGPDQGFRVCRYK